MNVTLVINLTATLGMGGAVWLAGTDHLYGPVYAIVVAYGSGLLTALSSQYHVTARPDRESE
jgi:hypothetical protein